MPVFFWKQRLVFDQVKTHSQERQRDATGLRVMLMHNSLFLSFFFLPVLYLWRRDRKISWGEKYKQKCFSDGVRAQFYTTSELVMLPTRVVNFISQLPNESPAPQVATCNMMRGARGRKVISSNFTWLQLRSLTSHYAGSYSGVWVLSITKNTPKKQL